MSKTVAELGRVDILVNNASEQHVSSAGIEDVPPEQIERVMRTNVRARTSARAPAPGPAPPRCCATPAAQLLPTRRLCPPAPAPQVFGYVFMAKAASKHMKAGAAIIQTVSIEAYEGMPYMVPYSASKARRGARRRAAARAMPPAADSRGCTARPPPLPPSPPRTPPPCPLRRAPCCRARSSRSRAPCPRAS